MSLLLQVLAFLLTVYLVALLGRIVFEWIQVFARSWRPAGMVLVVANIVYGFTDPPLNFLRRWIKPLRIGEISLDLAFLVIFLVVWFGQALLLNAAWALR
ncbi:MAG: YggT family protein [bacterium]|nr:YggT family protein [bacterium]